MVKLLGTRLARWAFNFFPAYRGTGGRITYIARDWSEVRVKLPLNWRTRNYVGTIYGGSIYAAADPFYMVMLIRRLGRDYVVWDKAASVRFLKPGRDTLYAEFHVPDAELDAVRNAAATARSVDRQYRIEWKDAAGTVHAVVEKTIYIRRRNEPAPESV